MFGVKQITSIRKNDCGATCLQMLLEYYGIHENLETLIEKCNTNIIGINGKDLVDCAKEYGLDMKAYDMPSEELFECDRPAIVWWLNNHLCIFDGLDEDGKVVVVDPDRGRFRITKETFDVFYANVSFFNGNPLDHHTVTYTERIKELEEQNEMLTECIIEMANIIYA